MLRLLPDRVFRSSQYAARDKGVHRLASGPSSESIADMFTVMISIKAGRSSVSHAPSM